MKLVRSDEPKKPTPERKAPKSSAASVQLPVGTELRLDWSWNPDKKPGEIRRVVTSSSQWLETVGADGKPLAPMYCNCLLLIENGTCLELYTDARRTEKVAQFILVSPPVVA